MEDIRDDPASWPHVQVDMHVYHFQTLVFSHVWCCLPKAYSIVDMNDSQFKVSEEDLQKPVNYEILKNYLWKFGGAPFPTAKDHAVPW